MFWCLVALGSAALGMSACGGDGDADVGGDSRGVGSTDVASSGSVVRVDPPSFVLDVRAAIDAVEAELGGPQEFFEVTANAQFTNVFVAVDDATAAVGYLFVDGELQPPSPKREGATGKTFTAADVDFDPALVTGGVANDLPTTTIDALSVYGDGFGAVFVLAATSAAGGFLDIEVGPEGDVRSVDPV